MRTETIEGLPQIGTVQNPAYFCDGETLRLAYEIAPIDGGGHAVMEFAGVIKLVQNPQTVEGTRNPNAYPISPWAITEVFDSEETAPWTGARFWTVSFNDLTIAVTFKSVQLLGSVLDFDSAEAALASFQIR